MHICAMQHMFDDFTIIKNSYAVNQFDKFSAYTAHSLGLVITSPLAIEAG